MSSRARYTNPIENLRSYIMIKAGIQKDERLSDLEWVEDKIKAGDTLAFKIMSMTDAPSELVQAAREWREL